MEAFNIGTNNGLNRYFPESKRIFSYTENKLDLPELKQCLMPLDKSPEGDLWFGTSNGVTRLRPDKAGHRSYLSP